MTPEIPIEENQANNSPVSGLDMGPTIQWYTAEEEKLLLRLPASPDTTLPFNLTNSQYVSMDAGRFTAVISLFPTSALQRSRLQTGTIIGKPSLYFSSESTAEQIQTTDDPSKALSSTAIIPSYTDNQRWQETGELSSDIWLCKIPRGIPPAVAEIIHTEGLVHEFAHTVITQALYQEGYQLKLPSGEIVNGYDYLLAFAAAAEKHDPVSHYSSTYRKSGEEFKSLIAIEEEFAETIAACLLGFAYCDNSERRLNPLIDRPEIATIVDDFLQAEEMV